MRYEQIAHMPKIVRTCLCRVHDMEKQLTDEWDNLIREVAQPGHVMAGCGQNPT